MPSPVYRKNDTDKQIVDNARKFDNSDITVNVDGKQREVGSPTGAGDNRIQSKAGYVPAWNERMDFFGDKAGKKRASDANPHN